MQLAPILSATKFARDVLPVFGGGEDHGENEFPFKDVVVYLSLRKFYETYQFLACR
jgi:hypothetical protein